MIFWQKSLPSAEYLTGDADDVICVGVVFGKDEGLGNLSATGEGFGDHLVAETLEDGANLAFIDHIAVELVAE